MKVHVVFSHPDPNGKSFNHALLETTVKALKDAGHEVRVRDLYKDNFLQFPNAEEFTKLHNPSHLQYEYEQRFGNLHPQVLEEHQNLKWASHVIMIAPIYWGTMPSSIHAYIERIMATGVIYTMQTLFDKGTFAGKKFMIATTTGSPKFINLDRSQLGTIEERLTPITFGAMNFTGFTPLRTQTFFGVRDVNDEVRKRWLKQWYNDVQKLDSREAIPFTKPTDYVNGVLSDESMETNYRIAAKLGDLSYEP